MIVSEEPSKPPHDPRCSVEDVMVLDPGPVPPGRALCECGMSHLDALEQELRELKLTRLADPLQGFLADAAKQEWDYGTFLGNVVKGELAVRRGRRTEVAKTVARLPFVKTMGG